MCIEHGGAFGSGDFGILLSLNHLSLVRRLLSFTYEEEDIFLLLSLTLNIISVEHDFRRLSGSCVGSCVECMCTVCVECMCTVC
jgi:hypothetical protein